ncbi:MAG: SRPBCC family protein [Phycisphaerales bacterium]|nr:MAG: SRPBCC family protein [Phycisphaerales bacterium]
MTTGNTVRLHRVLKAPASRVYKAFIDPRAMVKWMPPHGYVGEVHSHEAKVGGTYRMSFASLGSGMTHSFGGTYVELVENEKIVVTDRFDDPNLPGEMRVTTTLRPVSCGTEVIITQEKIPSIIPVEICTLGWQESLEMLAGLVEAEVE